MKDLNQETTEKFLKVIEKTISKELERADSKIGVTKKGKSPSKKARKQSKASRKTNRPKHRHHMTLKEKRARSKK